MMKPPTTLLVAATMAMVPSTVESVVLCSPARMMAPTTAMASERVGQRHQRRVQQRRHTANHFKADERRQHENVQAVNQISLDH